MDLSITHGRGCAALRGKGEVEGVWRTRREEDQRTDPIRIDGPLSPLPKRMPKHEASRERGSRLTQRGRLRPNGANHECGPRSRVGPETTNVAQRTRKEPRKSQPRTWHKEPRKEPRKSQPRTWHREPERNPGRISHERGTENQKGTLEESATTAAQGSRKGILEESRQTANGEIPTGDAS